MVSRRRVPQRLLDPPALREDDVDSRAESDPSRGRGLILGLLSVLVISPDALLIRLVEADDITLLFWRGALTTLGIALVLGVRTRGRVVEAFRGSGSDGLIAGFCFFGATMLFVVGVRHTAVATVLVMLCAGPLFAAILSRIFLGETIAPRTWVASGMVLCVVSAIVASSATSTVLTGNLAGVGAVLSFAAYLTVLRRRPSADMTPAVAIGGSLTGAVTMVAAQLSGGSLLLGADDVVALVLMGVVILPVALALMTQASRHLSAPEIGLLALLETMLGPLWVWMVLGEQPRPAIILAGGAILIVIIAHSALTLLSAGNTAGRSTMRPGGEHGRL